LLVSGHGGRCRDQTGKEYIDFICGYGPVVLGHANAEVTRAVVEQLEKGTLLPGESPPHGLIRSRLGRIFSGQDSLLFKTGSEAVAAAIRLARAFTGKEKLIRCGFHGWHDALISPSVSWHQYELDDLSPRHVAGVFESPESLSIITWHSRNLDDLAALFRAHAPHVAALLLDPVQLVEPIQRSLLELRELTRREGALLILDECKTGFRVHVGGVQGLYGVNADLTVLSKAIANGFPLACVVGRREILESALAARVMGTYNGELISIAAALVTLAILERGESQCRLASLGERLLDGINTHLMRFGLLGQVRAVPYRWPCMPYLWFRRNSVWAGGRQQEFYARLAARGVLMLPRHMNFVCLAHSEEDVDQAVITVGEVLDELVRENGWA
jgi:glutamate-1-semialdehyde 2,1-aminomutase